MNEIVSRMPMNEYRAIDALNISRLKELGRSALHYQHRLAHPLVTAPLTLGTAAHCATLEPERFGRQFAVWDRRTDSGRMAPRNGKWWDAFQAANDTRTILTEDERDEALTIATAVRADPVAMFRRCLGARTELLHGLAGDIEFCAQLDRVSIVGEVKLDELSIAPLRPVG